MSKTIDIRLKSGFDSTGVSQASKTLSGFHDKLLASNKSLLEINAAMSEKMRTLAQNIAVDYGAAADKAVRGLGRIYETLDEINARIDIPKKAAREQEELNRAIQRYNELCEERRRRHAEQMSVWKNPRSQWNQGPGAGSLYKPQEQAGGNAAGASAAQMARAAIPAMMAIDRMTGQLDGNLKKVASGLQGIIGMTAAFGPAGAAIGAAFAAIEWAMSSYIEKQMKAIEKIDEWNAKVAANNKAAMDSHFEKMAKDIDAVADAASRSAEAFELAARKSAEFAKIREGLNAAAGVTELLDMQRQMGVDVDNASESQRGKVAADWKLRIAEKEVELRERAADLAAQAERESLETAQKRVSLSQEAVDRLLEAENKAYLNYENVRKTYAANYENGESDPEVQRYKAEWEKANARTTQAQKELRNSQTDLEIAQHQAEVEAAQRGNSIQQARNAQEQAQRDAVKAAHDAEISAVKQAAAERERLDREIHRKRMDDLRAEIAAQKEAANPLRSVAAAAQTEFERAFAMYRDPSRAAAEIGEERDRANDLERLHRDARRYGGKWRIDELSSLMSAGDTQGVQDRLAEWRKSAKFTPEVEAMVRASAAEQTKTTAEDELRKLNDTTGELAARLETLSATRDGKLDGIERNTNDLAAKVDELLSVKG